MPRPQRAGAPAPSGEGCERLADGAQIAYQVEVRDSGPGIASELAEEVFRAGYSTKAAEIGGRGLGLALARQACLRRGGTIAVRPAPAGRVGAVFEAVLPVAPTGVRV